MTYINFVSNSENGFFNVEEKVLYLSNNTYNFKPSSLKFPSKLYIILSKQCNLSCVYCFQKYDRTYSYNFDENNTLTIITKYSKFFDEIFFFGGEPFIDENYDIIKKILDQVSDSKFIAFTNGNYSLKFQKLIYKYKNSFKCIVTSVDGHENLHNTKRINLTGNSFANAIRSIQKNHNSGINTILQINVDKTNIYDLDILLNEISLNRDNYGDIMFNPIKYTKNQLSDYDLISLYIKYRLNYPNLKLEIANRTINNLFSMLTINGIYSDRCSLKNNIVCDFSSNNIYACPENTTSLIGKIDKDKLIFSHSKLENEISISSFENDCSLCKFSYLCSKGCPYNTIINDNCKYDLINVLEIIFKHFDDLFYI